MSTYTDHVVSHVLAHNPRAREIDINGQRNVILGDARTIYMASTDTYAVGPASGGARAIYTAHDTADAKLLRQSVEDAADALYA